MMENTLPEEEQTTQETLDPAAVAEETTPKAEEFVTKAEYDAAVQKAGQAEARAREIQSRSDRSVSEVRHQAAQKDQILGDLQRENMFLRQVAENKMEPDEAKLAILQSQNQAYKQRLTQSTTPPYEQVPIAGLTLAAQYGYRVDDPRINYHLEATSVADGLEALRKHLEGMKIEDATRREAEVTSHKDEAVERVRAERGNPQTVPVETGNSMGKNTGLARAQDDYIAGSITREQYAEIRTRHGLET